MDTGSHRPRKRRDTMTGDFWRDIATAPKDGTEILLGWKKMVASGHYARLTNGWITSRGTYHGIYAPHFWMPLPPPPKSPLDSPINPP